MSKLIWITGASGYLGKHLYSFLSKSTNVVVPIAGRNGGFEDFGDLNDYNFILALLEKYGTPDVVIHCAGNKSISELEKNWKLAKCTNVGMALKLFNSLPLSTQFIFMSTDYVFNGEVGGYSESDKPKPNTLYGFSKYLTERYLRKFKNVAIIRTSAVYNIEAAFPDMLIQKFKSNEVVSCFSDLFYSPVYLPCFLNGVNSIINKDLNGVIHLTGECTSRYNFAWELAVSFGFDSKLIQPELKNKDGMITDLSLNSSHSWARLDIQYPTLRECLQHMRQSQ